MQILQLKINIDIHHYIGLLINGHTEAIKALISAQKNVEALDENQQTLLHWAASDGYAEAIRELIAAHANIEAQDNNRYTPLHWAASHGHAEAIRDTCFSPCRY